MARCAAVRRRLTIRALAALLGAPLAAAAAWGQEPPGAPPGPQELQELGAALESVYRRTPTCRHGGEAAEERDLYAALARQTELSSVVATIEGEDERLLDDGGEETPVLLRRLRLSGSGDFSALHAFLTRLSLRNRLVDLEALAVSADPASGVRFDARLALPCYEEPEAGEAKAGGGRGSGDPVAAARSRAERLYARLARLARESNPSRVVEALALFERRTQNRAFALTDLAVGREVELDALVFAPPARASLQADLEAAGFTVAAESMQSSGDCQRVLVRATIEPQEAPQDAAELEGIVSGNGLFDAAAPELCAGEAGGPVGRIAFRGTAPAEKSLTLRLRGVDLADVFLVLHDLTGQSFAVDADVTGRADVEIERATLDQALTAMAAAGLAVSPDRLHRVTRAGKAPAKPAKPYSGEAMDISVQHGDLLSTLCALSSVARRPVSFPRNLRGKVNVSARDVPVDEILDGVVAAAGLVAVPEKGSLFVGTEAQAKAPAQRGAVARCKSEDDEEEPLEGPGWSRLREKVEGLPSLAALEMADLELAGLVQSEGLWRAYVYAPPNRFLTRLDAGQALFESSVAAVGPQGVTVAGEGRAPRIVKLRP